VTVVDRREPLYAQVADQLEADLRAGRYGAGDRLPSERELGEQYDVSRVTVRQALGRLVERGMVESSAGRGWFVGPQPLAEPPGTLASFTEMAQAAGLQVASVVLEQQVREMTYDEAELLRQVPGTPLLSLRRLRRVDGITIALDHSRVPVALAPALIDTDFSRSSLYATFAAAGVHPERADYEVSARAASADQAQALGVEEGSPLLAATQVTFDRTGRPVELGAITYRADRYRFRTVLVSGQDIRSPWNR